MRQLVTLAAAAAVEIDDQIQKDLAFQQVAVRQAAMADEDAALASAGKIRDQPLQSLTLAEVAATTTRRGANGERVAEAIKQPHWQSVALASIANAHWDAGRVEAARAALTRARQIEESIEDQGERLFALKSVVYALVHTQDAEGASRLVYAPRNKPVEDELLAATVSALCDSGDISAAIHASERVNDAEARYSSLAKCLQSSAVDTPTKASARSLQLAKAAIGENDQMPIPDESLYRMSVALLATDEIERAAATANRIQDQAILSAALCQLALKHADEQQDDIAQNYASRIRTIATELRRSGHEDHDYVLLRTSRLYAVLGQYDAAFEMAESLQGAWNDAALVHIAEALVAKGRIEEALTAARRIKSNANQANAYYAICAGLAEAGQADESRRLAEGLAAPFTKSCALIGIADGSQRMSGDTNCCGN